MFLVAADGAANLAASGCASVTRARGFRMRRQPVRNAALAELIDPRQRRQETAARRPDPILPWPRNPSRRDRTRSRRRGRTSGTRRPARIEARSPNGCVAGTKMPSTVEPDATRRRARVLLRRVPRGHMGDLMAQHAGQLRLVVEIRQDAARDVDEAAGQRKRVDRRVIDNRERPRQIRPVRQRARAAVRRPARSAAARDCRRRPSRAGFRRRPAGRSRFPAPRS